MKHLCAEPGSLYKSGRASTRVIQPGGGTQARRAAPRSADPSETTAPHRRRHAGREERRQLEAFSLSLPAFGKFFPRLRRTDAVHLHVRAQEHGHMRGHFAEQRARGRLEEHRHSAAGDGSAAKGDHHESKGDHQGADLKVGPLREPERRRAWGRAARGQEERGWYQKHDGGCVEGPRGHFDAALADFAVAEAALRKPGGRQRGTFFSHHPLSLSLSVFLALWGTLHKAMKYFTNLETIYNLRMPVVYKRAHGKLLKLDIKTNDKVKKATSKTVC